MKKIRWILVHNSLVHPCSPSLGVAQMIHHALVTGLLLNGGWIQAYYVSRALALTHFAPQDTFGHDAIVYPSQKKATTLITIRFDQLP